MRHGRMGGYNTMQGVVKVEGDIIYLPLDGNGTDIAGTQLPARQAEMQILGGEPDLISRMIDGGGRPAGICIGLVLSHV